MNQTYGFVEIWLAKLIKIEFFEYGLENGSVVAAVDQDGFNIAFNTVFDLWQNLDKDEALKPNIQDSTVHGMKIAIHRYWVDDNLLNDLTGEVAKATDTYLNIFAIGPSGVRFVLADIEAAILNECNAPAEATPVTVDSDDAAIEEEAVPIEVPIEEEKKVSQKLAMVNALFEDLKEHYGTYTNITQDAVYEEEEVRVVIYDINFSEQQFEEIANIAKSIGKSIFYINNVDHTTNLITALKNKFNMAGLSKDVLFFIHALPGSTFNLTENAKASCFGYEIDEIYCITGSCHENDIINKIRRDLELNPEAKRLKIDEVINNRKNSPIYKYDGIYKDTITNVIWAVKDRCMIYFLVPYSTGKNKTFYKIAYEEFIKRFGNSLPYTELVKIDAKYTEKRHENNREEYINFAISSSKVITDQIKDKRDEHQKKYKEHLEQALEHAKMFQRFHDQIQYFNEEKFLIDEREKANKNYDETLALDKISMVTVKDNIVHVYTHNIYAQDERTSHWHDIGTFHITLGMHNNSYNQEQTVNIKNTKHQIKTSSNGSIMNAPHAWQDGHICHGNLASGMTDAYKRRNLFELIYQILLFLESANTSDSAGEKVNKWPEVSEEVALSQNNNDNALYEVMHQIAKAEEKFDKTLAEAIPVHI